MSMRAALLAGTAIVMMASSAMATVVGSTASGEKNLQTVLNEITNTKTSSVNVYKDFITDGNDALWTTGGTGISSGTMIIELSGLKNVNNFGIYDPSNVSNTALLFAGSASAGNKVVFTFGDFGNANLLVQNLNGKSSPAFYNFNSSTFGFYFNNGVNTFYSDTTKNQDGYDHMVAYGKPAKNDLVNLPQNPKYTPWLENEYVLAFEEALGGGDHDYNDLVLMVESVAPVPEPGTMVLLGAGFLGLAIYGKRRKNA